MQETRAHYMVVALSNRARIVGPDLVAISSGEVPCGAPASIHHPFDSSFTIQLAKMCSSTNTPRGSSSGDHPTPQQIPKEKNSRKSDPNSNLKTNHLE
jgi:hypothetical protein